MIGAVAAAILVAVLALVFLLLLAGAIAEAGR